MASDQAKIGWERPRKRKQKIIDPINSYPTCNRKFQRNCKKNSKNLKTPLKIILKRKQVGKARERKKTKIIVPINSYPTHNRVFEKICKKIQKIIKHHWGFFSNKNRLGKAKKERNRNYPSDQFPPDS